MAVRPGMRSMTVVESLIAAGADLNLRDEVDLSFSNAIAANHCHRYYYRCCHHCNGYCSCHCVSTLIVSSINAVSLVLSECMAHFLHPRIHQLLTLWCSQAGNGALHLITAPVGPWMRTTINNSIDDQSLQMLKVLLEAGADATVTNKAIVGCCC